MGARYIHKKFRPNDYKENRHKTYKMRNVLIINSYAVNGVALLLFCLFPLKGNCQGGEDAVNMLVKMGFTNVGWSENEKERIYVMENDAYRLQGVGIGKALDIIQKIGLPVRKSCRIIFLDNNIPQISLNYQPMSIDTTSIVTHADWDISYKLGDVKQLRQIKKRNSSLFKVDIMVYPELSFKNYIITQIYQVLTNFSPAVEVSLWKGMKFIGQIILPLYNDGYGRLCSKVRPQFFEITQNVRLPYNIWGKFAIGLFNNNRYGIDMTVWHHFSDEHFTIEGRIGYTGQNYWDGFTCYYGTLKRLMWSIGASYYLPCYNLETTVRGAQFLLGERGVRVDVVRHFRYASIGFYAEKANGANSNGGFLFQIALPPYKYKRKGYIPRVDLSNQFGISYNAGNEKYYYKEYKVMPSDNVMQRNSFNPYFIKSEILNY